MAAVVLAAFLAFTPLVAQRGEQAEQPKLGEVGSIPNLDPALRFELEEALAAKDYERAEQLLVNQIETNPSAPRRQLLLYLGGLFFVDKKYLNAAIAFKKAEAIEPIDNGNRFTLAMSYILLGRGDWARPELEKLNQADPAQPLYPYWIARLEYDDSKFAQAAARLQKIVEEHPDYVRAYDRLALCYEAQNSNEKAIEYYKKAIQLNRTQQAPSAWPPMNLGILLTQLGRPEEAEPHLREAVALDPNFAQAHYRLGFTLEKLNRFEEAAAALRQAANLDPVYPDPHWALARVLRRTGDRAGAEAAVREYQRLKQEQKQKR